jgi:hypothetical protein
MRALEEKNQNLINERETLQSQHSSLLDSLQSSTKQLQEQEIQIQNLFFSLTQLQRCHQEALEQNYRKNECLESLQMMEEEAKQRRAQLTEKERLENKSREANMSQMAMSMLEYEQLICQLRADLMRATEEKGNIEKRLATDHLREINEAERKINACEESILSLTETIHQMRLEVDRVPKILESVSLGIEQPTDFELEQKEALSLQHISSFEQEIFHLRNKYLEQENNYLQTLQLEIETKNLMQMKVAELEDSVRTHQERVTELEDSVRTHQERVTELEDSVRTHQERVTELEDSVRTHQERVTELEDSVRTHQERVAELEDSSHSQDEVTPSIESLTTELENQLILNQKLLSQIEELEEQVHLFERRSVAMISPSKANRLTQKMISLNCFIYDAKLRDRSYENGVIVYQILVLALDGVEWEVNRRYNSFKEIHEKINQKTAITIGLLFFTHWTLISLLLGSEFPEKQRNSWISKGKIEEMSSRQMLLKVRPFSLSISSLSVSS